MYLSYFIIFKLSRNENGVKFWTENIVVNKSGFKDESHSVGMQNIKHTDIQVLYFDVFADYLQYGDILGRGISGIVRYGLYKKKEPIAIKVLFLLTNK